MVSGRKIKQNNKWKIKYYKINISTSNEAKEYFKDLKVNQYITDDSTI